MGEREDDGWTGNGPQTGDDDVAADGLPSGAAALGAAVPGVPHVVDVLARQALGMHALATALLAASEAVLTTLRLVQVQQTQVADAQRESAADKLRAAAAPRPPKFFGGAAGSAGQ